MGRLTRHLTYVTCTLVTRLDFKGTVVFSVGGGLSKQPKKDEDLCIHLFYLFYLFIFCEGGGGGIVTMNIVRLG